MSSALRVLRIELRRNLGFLIFPFVAASIGYIAYAVLPVGVRLWPETALAIQGSIILAGPLAAGVAAWIAIRNKRRKMEELLATTPYSPAKRDLTLWGATVIWFGIAYLLAVAGVFVILFVDGAWGSPVLWPVVLGLFALIFNTTLGYVIGYYLPSLFTVPLVSVVTYWIQGVTVYRTYGTPAQYLSPLPDALVGSVFYGVTPYIFGEQSLFLLGLTGLGLVAVALKATRARSPLSWIALCAAFALTTVGAVLLLTTPVNTTNSMKAKFAVPYELKCTDRHGVTVCVHPAYANLLDESADIINSVSEPFVGLPGGPEKAEQVATVNTTLQEGTVEFFLYDETSLGNLAEDVAASLVDGKDTRSNRAQAAIMAWALKKAGYEHRQALWLIQDHSSIKAAENAMGRFEELGETRQRKWLQKNYQKLRQGNIKLEDLP